MSRMLRAVAAFGDGRALRLARRCASGAAAGGDVAAVNGQKISRADFDHKLESSPAARQTLTQLVQQDLIDQYAKDKNVTVTQAEIDKDESDIKAKYPPGQFENILKQQGLTEQDVQTILRQQLVLKKAVGTRSRSATPTSRRSTTRTTPSSTSRPRSGPATSSSPTRTRPMSPGQDQGRRQLGRAGQAVQHRPLHQGQGRRAGLLRPRPDGAAVPGRGVRRQAGPDRRPDQVALRLPRDPGRGKEARHQGDLRLGPKADSRPAHLAAAVAADPGLPAELRSTARSTSTTTATRTRSRRRSPLRPPAARPPRPLAVRQPPPAAPPPVRPPRRPPSSAAAAPAPAASGK